MTLDEFTHGILPGARLLGRTTLDYFFDNYAFSDTEAIFVGTGYLNTWFHQPRCQFCGAAYLPWAGAIPSQTCKNCRDEIQEALKQRP